jgi:hypothetical protein
MAIGWALVSTGRHADTCLAPAIGLAEDTRLVAVYSREQQRAEAFVPHCWRMWHWMGWQGCSTQNTPMDAPKPQPVAKEAIEA